MNTLQQQLRREWHLLVSDSWLRALSSWVPLLLFFIIWWIFSAGIPREIAIGVVDLDHSSLSRELIRQYDAHPGLRVTGEFFDSSQGTAAMRNGEIIALIIIPYDFSTKTITLRSPQITAFFNTQFLLTGNLVASAIQQAQGTFGVKLGLMKEMLAGKVGAQALAATVPVGTQITPLFNVNTNYANFLASAIIPACWQILIILITMLALSREIRLHGLAAWLGNQPLTAIAGKLLPYTLILWLQGLLFLAFLYGILNWPMNGSWAILILSQLLMVLASQAVGLLLFLLVKNAARALSIAAAYTAPSFAFMGISFPTTDMSLPAQLWRDMLPVSHYIEVQLYQTNHGASAASAVPQIAALLLFFIAFPLAYKLATRLQQQAHAA